MCPKHVDKRASGCIDLDGEYAGHYFCFSCGWHGKLKPHLLQKLMTKRKRRPRLITFDWERLNQEYQYNFAHTYIDLPFPIFWSSLCAFGIGWDGPTNGGKGCIEPVRGTYTFPMRNPQGQIIGIQRRFPDSTKCCVEGSTLGLFLPDGYWGQTEQIVDCRARQGRSCRLCEDCIGYDKCIYEAKPLFITEGLSDAASVYDLGFHAIGRPSCNTCEEMIKEYLELYGIEKVVIVADNDKVGIDGATHLLRSLEPRPDRRLLIYTPSFKDVREDIEKLGKEEVTKRLKAFA